MEPAVWYTDITLIFNNSVQLWHLQIGLMETLQMNNMAKAGLKASIQKQSLQKAHMGQACIIQTSTAQADHCVSYAWRAQSQNLLLIW